MKSKITKQTKMDKARRRSQKFGLPGIRRCILLCTDTKEAGCASKRTMKASWQYLRKRARQLGLGRAAGLLTLQSQCVGLCQCGPIAVVYPDGVWYLNCVPEVIDRILTDHILGDRVVEEYVLARPEADIAADETAPSIPSGIGDP